MHKIALIGAGNVGGLVVSLLKMSGDYEVKVGDLQAQDAARGIGLPDVTVESLDTSRPAALRRFLEGSEAVISCCPASCNPPIARLAGELGLHYFDPTEDVANAKLVEELARDGSSLFAPQCGVAPGYIAVLAAEMARRFDRLETLHLRVGALPVYPTNRLKYNLTWSTHGLINEYCNPCEAIVDGRIVQLLPLEGYETLSLDGEEYEAFNTSGGLGTLSQSLLGKVRELDYKTIRYPGHRDLIAFLFYDLKLKDDRELLQTILERGIPRTDQDKIIIFVTASGTIDGKYTQTSFTNKIYSREIGGKYWKAIQISTACGICTVVDLVFSGALPSRGFLRQEDIRLDDFLGNRFGRYYQRDGAAV